jgi:hypothetical protein
MHEKHSLIDSPHQAVSNDRWHATWFLRVEELFPLKDEASKYGQEAPYLRLRRYMLALNSSKGEKIVANKKLQVNSRSSKEGAL